MGAGCSRTVHAEPANVAPIVQAKSVPKGSDESTPWVPEKKVVEKEAPEESNVVVVVAPASRTQSRKAPEETTAYGGSTRKLTILHFNVGIQWNAKSPLCF